MREDKQKFNITDPKELKNNNKKNNNKKRRSVDEGDVAPDIQKVFQEAQKLPPKSAKKPSLDDYERNRGDYDYE